MNSDQNKPVQEENAATEEYAEALRQIKDYCPFCPGQMTHHKHPIEYQGSHWLVTKNSYNYQDAKYPYLLIHREHITTLQEISKTAWSELYDIYRMLVEKNQITGGTILMRFGDPRATGATVSHLHAHLVAADPDRPDQKPIMARIG